MSVVGDMSEEIAELRKELAAKDAEIAELKKSNNVLADNLVCCTEPKGCHRECIKRYKQELVAAHQEISALKEQLLDMEDKLIAALETALTVLEQIATTPRNRGAKRNATAAVAFLRTQLDARHNALAQGPRSGPAGAMGCAENGTTEKD